MSHASHASSNMARNSRKAAEEMRDGAHSVIETVQEKAGNIAHNVQKMGSDAASAVKEQVEHVRESAVGYWEDGRDRAMQLEHRLESTVQERPITSVLIAVGCGFLIGLLCRRA
jgi:ElaB/YqjD/DUF883 family membrane-anchored ribosome-binding protein